MTKDSNSDRPILFFDGVCNLCNRFVQFIIRHDRQKQFRFAPLQSEAGKKAVAQITAGGQTIPDSVILYYKGRYFFRSAAALHTLRLLGGGLAVAYAFIIIPSFLRDVAYGLIARNRYKWFGRRDSCMVPTPELLDRFLS